MPITIASPLREAIRQVGGDHRAVRLLARIHGRMWRLEDEARSNRASDATIVQVKRSIDRLNGMRHRVIDRIDDSIRLPEQSSVSGPVRYSETFGELTDRLIILEYKIQHARRLALDATLPETTRRRCGERAAQLEIWRTHLCDVLAEQANDGLAGTAMLPPRSEFKMYNDPELNPVLIEESRHA